MRRMGEFRSLSVTPSNTINGEASIWEVSFKAIAEVKKGDQFTIEIPYTIKTPTDPICTAVKCLQYEDNVTKEILCSAERTKIIVTLDPQKVEECTKYDAEFKFTIGKGTFKPEEAWSGIINAPSGLSS